MESLQSQLEKLQQLLPTTPVTGKTATPGTALLVAEDQALPVAASLERGGEKGEGVTEMGDTKEGGASCVVS